MFHNIPHAIAERMKYLESLDSKDRIDGTTRLKRLRQIPPETGKFIAILASQAPEGKYIEIGTSAGYSTMWISLACSILRRKQTTFEILEDKAILASETIRSAGIDNIVELKVGDARDYIQKMNKISFCFLDAEKEMYLDCYEKVIPNMVSGGILVADNVISHEEELKDMIEVALNDTRGDALIVPIGKGELVFRKL